MSLLRISRDRDGALELAGRSWQEDGMLSARYWSEAVKERKEPAGIFYYWKGERPRHPNAPLLDGTGEIRLESAERASGHFITRSESQPQLATRTSGVYLRANPEDLRILDGTDVARRAELENVRLPPDLDYGAVRGLSKEVQQTLQKLRPETLGQAGRISGITPAAISLLLVHLKRGFAREDAA